MLSFDWGYLVVLGAVVVILFIYRQLDKNNRSLEKIRKFAETVRQELNTFVEERTAAVKDFETVLKVHDKTAAEILRRIQSVESNLLTRTPEIEAMQMRLDRYSATMAELDAQTLKVDGNLDRLKQETVFVDRVTQRIKAADDQMKALETAFVQIRQEFADINQKDLETVRKNAFDVFERETLAYVQQLREAQKQIDGFQVLAADLEARKDSIAADAETAMRARSETVLEATEAAFRDTARQAEDLSSIVFLNLETRIEKQAQDSENRMRLEVAAREAAVREGVEALQVELADAERRLRDGVEAGQSAFRQTVGALQDEFGAAESRLRLELAAREAAVREGVEAFQNELLEADSRLRADVHARDSAVRESMDGVQDELVAAESRLRLELVAREAAIREGVDGLQNGLIRTEDRLRAEVAAREASVREGVSALQGELADAEARLREELAEREASVRQGVDALQIQLVEVDARVAEGTQALNTLLETTQKETQVVEAKTQHDLASLQSTLKDAAAQLRRSFQEEQAQLLAMTGDLRSDLDLRLAAVRTEGNEEADALRAEFRSSLELERESAQALASEIKAVLATSRRETQESEQLALETLDAKLKDYETGFAYRYGKMEEAEKDLAALDQNLRQAMDRVAERFQRDFSAFDEAMNQRREAEQASLDEKINASQASMIRLDKELEELKSRAYDNVSEKLQGFEEVFFADLQRRNASMAESLEDWQKTLQGKLDELQSEAERDRADVEKRVSEAFRARVLDLQTTSFQQMERLERQVLDAQGAAETSVTSFKDEVEQTKARLVEELVEMERVLDTRFEQDRARAELSAGEALTKLERDLEGRTRLLAEELDQFKIESKASVDAVQSEFGLWQTKFSQRFKDWESELGDQQREFKASLAEKIGALSQEFTSQKDDLVTKSAEDRAGLRQDLASIKEGVEELEMALRTRSQSAVDAFGREYEALSLDFQKKNREFTADIENKLRGYREGVNDMNEKAEAMQKKAFGKIEDQAGLLTVSIEEIEKRQKNFIAQTKVFERADTLKQELQDAIEDLKADVARVELQRKDLFEIESSVARIKKLGDETNEKAARFAADKKRIDLMDTDFQRILGISQSMELRLQQVSSSHDLLQDIQLRIRKLEDYSKDIEVRYERLEKRREVLDTTADGVDRNFALLEKTEKIVRGLDTELKAMPAEVEDLRKRLKVLAQGKEDADKAVERLALLDQTLREVESRIGRMEQAREWIAGVETRLTETKAAAEEQVQTLATITKAAGGPAPKAGSADSDLRRSVLKLAQQGWRKEEISRATKLSLGEVELILELGSR